MKNPNRLYRVVLFLALFIGFFLFFYFGGNDYLSFSYIKSQLMTFNASYVENPVRFITIYFLVYVISTAVSLPGAAVLTLLGGAIFGLTVGTIVVSFASTIGATLAFLISRFLLFDWVKTKFRSRYESVQKEFEKNGSFFVFSIRLAPMIPFFVANMVLGLTPIRVGAFYLASQIGMLPGTIVYVNAGKELGQLDSLSGILTLELLLAFLALAAIPWIGKYFVGVVNSKKIYKRFQKPKSFDYQMVVVGGGSAGLVAANLASSLKMKVALIEKHKMGGDCLNTGCVPSKTLLRTAKLLHQIQTSKKYGIKLAAAEIDFDEVMGRVQSVIKTIEPHDSMERYRSLGVECFKGDAKILSPFEVQVGSHILKTRHIIVASGAGPRVPPFPGLDKVSYLTSDTLWNLKELPKRLLVLGGGPIGCELAQAFSRLGSEVSIMEGAPRLLVKEDEEVSDLIKSKFESEGIKIYLDTKAKFFERVQNFGLCVGESKGEDVMVEFDFVLLAMGRVANVAGFGLEELEIDLRNDGTIETNDYLQSNIPNIWACGDVTGPYQFTHSAGNQGAIAAMNVMASPFKKFKWDTQAMPWVTFTDPEVAHIGLTEGDAKKKEIEIDVQTFPLSRSDRALAESGEQGFVKVLLEKGRDKILGVTIVGEHAGDMLAEFSLAMKLGKGLGAIMSVIHPYPTLSEANKSVALQWRKSKTPPWILKVLEKFNQMRL